MELLVPSVPSAHTINLVTVFSLQLLATGVREARADENVPLYSDCRFWAGSTQEDLKLRQKKMKRKHRVFYFWDTKKKECLPCSRCQSQGLKTIVACKYFRDTVCVNESVWDNKVYERTRSDYLQDYDDGGLGPVGDEEDEAVMVYRERAPSPVTQGPDVWGERSNQRDGGRTDSPTVQLARSTNNNNFKNSPGDYSDFGKPMFYSEQKFENSVERPERPIVDVIREFLESNVTHEGSFRDVKNLPKTYNPTLPPPNSAHVTFSPFYRRITTSMFVMTTTPHYLRRKLQRNQQVKNQQHNNNNFKRTNWSQRQATGNRQTNLIITESPVNYEDDGNADDDDDDEDDNDDDDEFGITHKEIEVTTRSAGEKAFEKIRHLIQQGTDEPTLQPLQLTLLLASVVAGVLLVVLIGILAVNKYRASRFKLLNNADTTYHSMSPFHTTAPVQALESSSLVTEEVISVHPAIVRSLKNIRAAGEQRAPDIGIGPAQQSRTGPVRQDSLQSRMSSRQDSLESRSTLHSTILDDRVRSIDDRSRSVDDRIRPVVVSPQSCIVDERGRTVLKP